MNHTRSSTLRNQLAAQRRAAEAQTASASMPNSVPRMHGTIGAKPSGQAIKPPLPHAASAQPSKVKRDVESIDLATNNITPTVTTTSVLDPGTTHVDPNTALLLPPQPIQDNFFVGNRQENRAEMVRAFNIRLFDFIS